MSYHYTSVRHNSAEHGYFVESADRYCFLGIVRRSTNRKEWQAIVSGSDLQPPAPSPATLVQSYPTREAAAAALASMAESHGAGGKGE